MASFDRIRQVLRDGPPLRVAILFGSRARGAPRHDSDYDLAILPVDPELPLSQETLLAATLEQAAGAPFDVVRLDRAVPALRCITPPRIGKRADAETSSPGTSRLI